MLFNSLSFLVFLVVVLIVYPRLRHRAASSDVAARWRSLGLAPFGEGNGSSNPETR